MEIMEWKNAGRGTVPGDQAEVLISVNNEKYVAVYDSGSGIFKVKSPSEKLFSTKEYVIYWTEIKKP